jgi:hypothetical protein
MVLQVILVPKVQKELKVPQGLKEHKVQKVLKVLKVL